MNEARHFQFHVQIDLGKYYQADDKIPPKGAWTGSHYLFELWDHLLNFEMDEAGHFKFHAQIDNIIQRMINYPRNRCVQGFQN